MRLRVHTTRLESSSPAVRQAHRPEAGRVARRAAVDHPVRRVEWAQVEARAGRGQVARAGRGAPAAQARVAQGVRGRPGQILGAPDRPAALERALLVARARDLPAVLGAQLDRPGAQARAPLAARAGLAAPALERAEGVLPSCRSIAAATTRRSPNAAATESNRLPSRYPVLPRRAASSFSLALPCT